VLGSTLEEVLELVAESADMGHQEHLSVEDHILQEVVATLAVTPMEMGIGNIVMSIPMEMGTQSVVATVAAAVAAVAVEEVVAAAVA